MHSFGLTERWLVLAEFPFVVNPLRARARRAPLHRELPLEARARHALHARRPRAPARSAAASRPTRASPSTTSTPTRRATRWSSTSAPTATRGSSRTSTWSGCAPGKPIAEAPADALPPRAGRRDGQQRAAQRRAASSCRGSTTGAATSGPTATCGASGTAPAAGSRGSSRSTSHDGSTRLGAGRLLSRASRCSSPRPDAAEEDDGVLLSVVLDAAAEQLVPARARRPTSASSPARRCPTTSRSASTASSRAGLTGALLPRRGSAPARSGAKLAAGAEALDGLAGGVEHFRVGRRGRRGRRTEVEEFRSGWRPRRCARRCSSRVVSADLAHQAVAVDPHLHGQPGLAGRCDQLLDPGACLRAVGAGQVFGGLQEIDRARVVRRRDAAHRFVADGRDAARAGAAPSGTASDRCRWSASWGPGPAPAGSWRRRPSASARPPGACRRTAAS